MASILGIGGELNVAIVAWSRPEDPAAIKDRSRGTYAVENSMPRR
jgi:hypothetical protein